MVKALLVGSIAREDAIAEAIAKTGELHSFVSSKNPGIIKKSKSYCMGKATDAAAVLEFVKTVDPDYVIIGSDEPIAVGLADPLVENGYGVVAPLKELARLESDKAFARLFMEEYVKKGIPKNFSSKDASKIDDYIDSLDYDFVVKPMGLTGGKGVKVMGQQLKTVEEAKAYAREVIETKSDSGIGGVVIEEKLVGEEFSLQSFVDGDNFAPMPLAQDHKQAFENDLGPMTGGMGSYSDSNHLLPFVSQKDYEEAVEIVRLTVKGIKDKTGQGFKGILYSQFMMTKKGPFIVEYNVRFADPESMNVLPILKNDFNEVAMAIVEERLDEEDISFENQATVLKYLVPRDYPDKKVSGHMLSINESVLSENGVKAYYGGVEEREGRLYTTGSRAVGVFAKGNSISEAEEKVEKGISLINDSELRHRKDIATADSLAKKKKQDAWVK